MGLKALGKNTLIVVPPSCLTVLQGLYPIAATKLPSLNVTFASTAAAATGLLAALKATGRKGINVVGWAGDGGTSDIGLQALSGACERGDDFLFICYDNDGYMNTGVQRSGTCLLYTSDAADDLLCVDLVGCRILKKKKQPQINT